MTIAMPPPSEDDFAARFSVLSTSLLIPFRTQNLATVLTNIDSLINDYVLNPMCEASLVQRASRDLQKHCSPYLVRVLGRLAEEDGAEDTMSQISDLLAKLAGRGAMKQLVRKWGFPSKAFDVGTVDIWEPSYGECDIGFQTWGAGVVLAKLLVANEIPLTASRILELGSGTGLAGIVAARIGRSLHRKFEIVLTDYHPNVLSNLRRNAHANGVDACTLVGMLDWTVGTLEFEDTGAQPHDDALTSAKESFEQIIASDFNYEPSHAHLIPAVVARYLSRDENSRFWSVLPVRPRFEAELDAFYVEMNRRGFVRVHSCRITDDVSGDQVDYLVDAWQLRSTD
ncbi:hypothetical protein BC832DRAFT_543979 [Gaertneriomyces semiglobifer]|nr:hypothetical protein BC832DRAFT_543979 [Gaertneriomyces semiglobifer]